MKGTLTPVMITAMNGFLNCNNLDINKEFKDEMDEYLESILVTKLRILIGNNYYYPSLSAPAYYPTVVLNISTALGNKSFLADLVSDRFISEYILDWSYRILGTHYSQNHSNPCAKFIQTFQTLLGYTELSNNIINSSVNSSDISAKTFTSMNDLITGNLSLVTNNTKKFGEDLSKTGIFYDFSELTNFGTPHSLVSALIRSSAIGLLKDEFKEVGIEVSDITSAITSTDIPLLMQVQQVIYSLSKTIKDEKLIDILLMLNISTTGLNSLADLLDLTKMFPSSYKFLKTMINGEVKMIYEDMIHKGTGISESVSNLSSPYEPIMPSSVAKANLAFRNSLFQIKNILSVKVQDLAEQFKSIEINTGLDTISTNDSAISNSIINDPASGILYHIGKGQNYNGTFFVTDGVGSPTGVVHIDTYKKFNAYLKSLNATDVNNIQGIADDIIDEIADAENNYVEPVPAPPDPEADKDQFIADQLDASGLLTSLSNALSALPNVPADILTQIDKSLDQIVKEQETLNDALDFPPDVYAGLDNPMSEAAARKIIMGFVSALHGLSEKTDLHGPVEVLEKLAVQNETGDAIISSLREGRNINRMNKANIKNDNFSSSDPKIVDPRI